MGNGPELEIPPKIGTDELYGNMNVYLLESQSAGAITYRETVAILIILSARCPLPLPETQYTHPLCTLVGLFLRLSLEVPRGSSAPIEAT